MRPNSKLCREYLCSFLCMYSLFNSFFNDFMRRSSWTTQPRCSWLKKTPSIFIYFTYFTTANKTGGTLIFFSVYVLALCRIYADKYVPFSHRCCAIHFGTAYTFNWSNSNICNCLYPFLRIYVSIFLQIPSACWQYLDGFQQIMFCRRAALKESFADNFLHFYVSIRILNVGVPTEDAQTPVLNQRQDSYAY